MPDKSRTEVLKRVLGVARAISEIEDGLSIAEALIRSGYVENRANLTPSDFISFLEDDPEIAESWCQFSEDKRTSGGWYILRDTLEIGTLEDDAKTMRFDSLAQAVAAYVVVELDFWASVNAT